MVGGHDASRPLDPVGVLEQRDDVERAGLLDRVVEACKRADVDHRWSEAVVCVVIWGQIVTRKGHCRNSLREALEIALFGHLRGPGREIVALDGGREFGRRPEELAGLRAGKTGEPRRFEIGGGAIGGLDQGRKLARQHRRQAEAQMDGGEQPRLDRLVGVADHRLERRDHVADHVFRRVVQQNGKPALAVEARRAGAPAFRPAANAGRRRRCAGPRSVRSSAPRARAHGRCPRSRRRAATDRAGRAGAPTACAARRGTAPSLSLPQHQRVYARLRRAVRGGQGGGRFRFRGHQRRLCLAQAACRWQVTRWSLTMPTACMKA